MNKFIFESILPIVKTYKFRIFRVLLILILLAFFESISLALLPLSLSFFVDNNAINNLPKVLTNLLNDYSSKQIGIYFSTFILLAFIFKNYLSILSAKYISRLTCLLKDNWRLVILNNYIYSELTLISSIPTGVILENVINQSELAAKFIKTLIKTISYVIISFSLILSLFITSFKITLTTSLIFFTLGYISSFKIKRISSRIGRKNLKYRQLISKTLNDYLNGIFQVKIFNLEDKLKKEILINSKLQSNYTEKSSIIAQIPSLIGSFALVLILVIVLLSSWSDQNINITQIATFILISQKLQIYIANLLQSYSSLRMQKASFDLVQKLIKINNQESKFIKKDLPKNKIKLNTISSLKFKNVSFNYSENISPLKEVNFSLQSGDLMFIYGESGCGKSTIVNLASGLIDKKKGQIFINDHPIEEIDLKHYRSKISYVSQDNFLFNDSILNNLTLREENINMEWIIKCCKYAGAYDFIMDLPNSFQTLVGERGFSLSGGQLQRICIARAFIKNGDVIIFDEATSALDKKNEDLILNSLRMFSKSGKMTMFISHKLQSNNDDAKNLFLEK